MVNPVMGTAAMKKALILFTVWWVVLNLFAVGVFFRFRITEPDTAYGGERLLPGLLEGVRGPAHAMGFWLLRLDRRRWVLS